MKNYPKYIAAVLLFSLAAGSCSKKNSDHPVIQGPDSIYEVAVKMLAEFIREGPDSNLGIRNFDELDSLKLRKDLGIHLYYMFEGSRMGDQLPIDSQLVKLHRMIFPVFYHDSLRASITFDNTEGGWHAVVFDGPGILQPYIAGMLDQKDTCKDSTTYMLVTLPALNTNVLVRKNCTGQFDIPTVMLAKAMGPYFPNTGKKDMFAPIPSNIFIDSLRAYTRNQRLQMKRQGKT